MPIRKCYLEIHPMLSERVMSPPCAKNADAQKVRRRRLTYLKQFRNHLNNTLFEWIGKLANGLDINQFDKRVDAG